MYLGQRFNEKVMRIVIGCNAGEFVFQFIIIHLSIFITMDFFYKLLFDHRFPVQRFLL